MYIRNISPGVDLSYLVSDILHKKIKVFIYISWFNGNDTIDEISHFPAYRYKYILGHYAKHNQTTKDLLLNNNSRLNGLDSISRYNCNNTRNILKPLRYERNINVLKSESNTTKEASKIAETVYILYNVIKYRHDDYFKKKGQN